MTVDQLPLCPECAGTGLVVCPCCEVTEEPCETCAESGYDPEHVDVAGWKKARDAFDKKHFLTRGCTIPGAFVGRITMDGKHQLDFRPFIVDYEDEQ